MIADLPGRIRRRILPFLLLLYGAAYLDRINVGFAALEMKKDLGLSDAVYGLGAGLFFVGYFLFEVPSNLILERVGARRWIARIMISWGLLSSSMMFARTPPHFYMLRFLLGVAEAGFFPGIILYLTYWFPGRDRARAMAQFLTAAMLAWIVGGPVSGALLGLGGIGGLAGWQWLFLLEGIPSMILGGVVLLVLDDGPATARWLNADERRWILDDLARERLKEETRVRRKTSGVLFQGRTLLLCLIYFLLTVSSYGLSLWLPQVLSAASTSSPVGVGFLSVIPYSLTAAGMLVIASRSDRKGERRLHVAVPLFAAAAGLAMAAGLQLPAGILAARSVALVGNFGCLGPFWALSTRTLGPRSAAAGIAMINSLGNLGGFVGPYLVGLLKTGGGFSSGFLLLAGSLTAAGALTLMFVREDVPAPAEENAAEEPVGDQIPYLPRR